MSVNRPHDHEEARALLAGAPLVHGASTTPDGAPIVWRARGHVDGDAFVFRSAEAAKAAGRAAVIVAEETIATIPSDADHETYALRAELRGELEPAGDRLIVRIAGDRLRLRARTGHDLPAEERTRLLERLWMRGLPGDPRAIDRLRALYPETPDPPFLEAPEGLRLTCALGEADVEAATDLLVPEYWNIGVPRAAIAGALRGATAWVGAKDAAGELVALARGLSDGAKIAWVFDVCVAKGWRRRGLGRRVTRLLLEHPAIRHARAVRLSTRDAQGVYAALGFVDVKEAPLRPWPYTDMALLRAAPPGALAHPSFGASSVSTFRSSGKKTA